MQHHPLCRLAIHWLRLNSQQTVQDKPERMELTGRMTGSRSLPHVFQNDSENDWGSKIFSEGLRMTGE